MIDPAIHIDPADMAAMISAKAAGSFTPRWSAHREAQERLVAAWRAKMAEASGNGLTRL